MTDPTVQNGGAKGEEGEISKSALKKKAKVSTPLRNTAWDGRVLRTSLGRWGETLCICGANTCVAYRMATAE
jgi:hypothetical protein